MKRWLLGRHWLDLGGFFFFFEFRFIVLFLRLSDMTVCYKYTTLSMHVLLLCIA